MKIKLLHTIISNVTSLTMSLTSMSMESEGEMILTGKTEELGEKPVPVPFCPSQILF
jgi:hypothetical protein